MDEQTAKTKWCPFARVTVTPNDADWQGNMLTNRGAIPASNTDTLCIGSDCMAWRWTLSPSGVAELNLRGNSSAVTSGFCGLSGRP